MRLYEMNDPSQFKKTLDKISESFGEHTPGSKYLIWYHWNQCGHCVHMQEDWNAMKKLLKQSKDLHIVDLEYNALQKLRQQHKAHPLAVIGQHVTGFPVIMNAKIGKNGTKLHITDYNDWYNSNGKGDNFRSTASFVKFAHH
jgi:glutaredoxin